MGADLMRTRDGRIAACCVLLLAAVVLWLSLPGFIAAVAAILPVDPVDMRIFARQAETFWQTGQLYQRADNVVMAYLPNAAVYKFPPPFQLYIAPWMRHGMPPLFFEYCRWLLLVAYLLAVVLLVRLGNNLMQLAPVCDDKLAARLWPMVYGVIAVLVTLHFTPFFNGLTLIAIEVIFLLLFTLVLLTLRTYPLFAGALLALAATAKIYPVFLLTVLLWQRNWRALLAFAVASTLVSLVALLVFGIAEVGYYTGTILPVLLAEQPVGWAENLHLVFYLFPDGISHAAARAICTALRFFFLAAWLLVLWRRQPGSARNETLVFSLALVTMLLIMPNYWLQYQVMLLLPALLVFTLALSSASVLALSLAGLALLSMALSPEQVYPLLSYSFGGSTDELYALVLREGEQSVMLRYAPAAWLVGQLAALKPLAPYCLWLALVVLLFGRPAQDQRLPEKSFFSRRSFSELLSANPMRAR